MSDGKCEPQPSGILLFIEVSPLITLLLLINFRLWS